MNAPLRLALGLAVCLVPLSLSAQADAAPVCLVLVSGVWTPHGPGREWAAPRVLTLRPERDSLMAASGHPQPWRVVRVEQPGRGPDAGRLPEADQGWVWLAHAGDSVALLRPAMLSAGMQVRGVWRGDTLRARANVFADLIRFPQPRANAYAVRFSCGQAGAADRALRAAERLAQADVPDRRRAAAEDSLAAAALQ